MPLLNMLETECIADCRGIEAFGLGSEDIELALNASNEQERVELSNNLPSIAVKIGRLSCENLRSDRLNQYFRKATFLALLAHIRSTAIELCSNRGHQTSLRRHPDNAKRCGIISYEQ
jgi:hypothetical protein